MRVVVTGGTGFIGLRLCERLISRGWEVVVLSRSPAGAARLLPVGARAIPWEGRQQTGSAVDGAQALVNLAGESVAQRWSSGARQRILQSRIAAVAALREAVERSVVRPRVLVNASAVGYYGDRPEGDLDEESAPGEGFLSETCVAWEREAETLTPLGLRVVRARIGMVLGPRDGALGKMLLPFRLGLGGPLGSGEQWVPWIHREDLVSLLVWTLETPAVAGALNATAPEPVRMAELARTLGKVLRRPAFAPAPSFALRLALGEMAELVLGGQRVLPAKALALGFRFRFPRLEEALADLLR